MLRERFAAGLVLDGGMATELERRGADLSDSLWSARILVDDPALIRQVHADFFAAGADVAISASYQASFEGFAARGIDRDAAAAVMRRSVALAREAADEVGPDRLVAASIGPYGATRADGSEYVGRYGLTVRELIDFHRPRLETLLDASPDMLAVETIPAIEEVEAILTLLDEHPEARAWVSFSCRDAHAISDGTPFRAAATLAASAPNVLAIGVNCSPPGFVPALLRDAASTRAVAGGSPAVPLLAYPNVGSTWDAVARAWRAEGPRPDFGREATRWREAGATIVGGCCGTTPDDIAAIAAGR